MTDDALFALAEHLGAALTAQGWFMATAESCTGGLVAGTLTSVPGSSGWFDRGVASYSNQAKIDLLGVSAQSLRDCGAVSEQVAGEMATGALAAWSDVHVAVATTGIAGPGGGTLNKPVGMVCFGFALRGKQGGDCVLRTTTCHFTGDRAWVRRESVRYALEGLLALIQTGGPSTTKISSSALR